MDYTGAVALAIDPLEIKLGEDALFEHEDDLSDLGKGDLKSKGQQVRIVIS